MKHLPAVGVVIAVLALFLSSAALVAGSGGGGEVTAEMTELNDGISVLAGRVAALKTSLASASKEPGDASTTLSSLRDRVERTEAEATRVEKALADLPDAPAAAGGAMDPGKLREVVQAEITKAREEWTRTQGDRVRRDMTARIREGFGLDEEKAGKVYEVQRKMWGQMGSVWRENRGNQDAIRK
ncbi:MAG: hypothetical protein ACYS9X_20035, partial [Planctomycetota bacterium]